MSVSLIVAMSRNRVIGKNNQLPWRLPEDLKRFKELTMGHPIIMGRKTYESIGKPLPGRTNIVLTKDTAYQVGGIQVARSLEEALNFGGKDEEKFVIGGSEVFKKAYPLCDKIYLTLIDRDFDGDTFFPELDLETDFNLVEETKTLNSPKEDLPYRFVTVSRKPAHQR